MISLLITSALCALDTSRSGLEQLQERNETQPYEPGKAVFKIAPSHRSSNPSAPNTTGIPTLDQKIAKLTNYHIEPRFKFNPQKRKEGSPDLSDIHLLSFDPSIPVQAAINILVQEPGILYAEPLYIDEAFDVPNDPRYASSLYFQALQAEDAWAVHKGENGTVPVIIAVVDTGVNWKHSDLAQNIWQNFGEDANQNGYTMFHNGSAWVLDIGDLNGIDDDGNGKVDDLIGWDFMVDANGNQGPDPIETSGHGTNVSGIANARTNNGTGVASLAWNVLLMPISCSYPAMPSSVFRGYDGIIFAAEHGADIINCSWGGTGFSQANQEAVNYAYSLGSVIIAAAGNSNSSTPLYPAAYQNVVAVAALNNNGVKSSVSNFGAYISVAAPNQSVDTTSGSSYSSVSGATSYASPIASSLAALIKSYHPSWTNSQIVNQLVASCDFIDNLNPGKENLLGQGKLNACRALTDIDPVPDQELKLALHQIRTPSDANNNRAIEAGESFSLNLTLRNYAWGASANNVVYTLFCADPLITVSENSFSGSIAADSYVHLDNAFQIQVSPLATSKYVTFTLQTSSEIPVVTGSSLTFQILINAGGIFVWEGKSNVRDMSGSFIRNRLQELGYQSTYGTTFPASLYSFDAVFLSFGMVGSNISRFNTPEMYHAVKEYLQGGGRLYIEGCDAIGFDIAYYLPNVDNGFAAHEILHPLLGIEAAEDGGTNPVTNLHAPAGWHTNGLQFTSSNQAVNNYIDTFTPSANGIAAFQESDYGTVAIQGVGAHSQRSFVFSYALAELADGTGANTRNGLMDRILEFFTASELVLPDIQNLSISTADETLINIQWSYPFAVDGFRIHSSESPDGDFENLFGTNTVPEFEFNPTDFSTIFLKIIAEKSFGRGE